MKKKTSSETKKSRSGSDPSLENTNSKWYPSDSPKENASVQPGTSTSPPSVHSGFDGPKQEVLPQSNRWWLVGISASLIFVCISALLWLSMVASEQQIFAADSQQQHQNVVRLQHSLSEVALDKKTLDDWANEWRTLEHQFPSDVRQQVNKTVMDMQGVAQQHREQQLLVQQVLQNMSAHPRGVEMPMIWGRAYQTSNSERPRLQEHRAVWEEYVALLKTWSDNRSVPQFLQYKKTTEERLLALFQQPAPADRSVEAQQWWALWNTWYSWLGSNFVSIEWENAARSAMLSNLHNALERSLAPPPSSLDPSTQQLLMVSLGVLGICSVGLLVLAFVKQMQRVQFFAQEHVQIVSALINDVELELKPLAIGDFSQSVKEFQPPFDTFSKSLNLTLMHLRSLIKTVKGVAEKMVEQASLATNKSAELQEQATKQSEDQQKFLEISQELSNNSLQLHKVLEEIVRVFASTHELLQTHFEFHDKSQRNTFGVHHHIGETILRMRRLNAGQRDLEALSVTIQESAELINVLAVHTNILMVKLGSSGEQVQVVSQKIQEQARQCQEVSAKLASVAQQTLGETEAVFKDLQNIDGVLEELNKDFSVHEDDALKIKENTGKIKEGLQHLSAASKNEKDSSKQLAESLETHHKEFEPFRRLTEASKEVSYSLVTVARELGETTARLKA